MKARIPKFLVGALLFSAIMSACFYRQRPDHFSADLAWHGNQTPENEAELDRQIWLTTVDWAQHAATYLVVSVALGLPGLLLLTRPKTPLA
jgi:hypothetical protein